ncbi:Ppx/GppA family phosphatase [Prosthecomicrobium sp. N25]|uniref:Ppx/GppA family phosphatase n=1 Tax=Prosthecomicrobium sp. N25 TaxID=3129254 RepID=UPI003076E449
MTDALEGAEYAPGRLAGAGPIAVVDIGSNSVRLVIYERLCRSPTLLFNEKVLAGLGKGVGKTNRLGEQPVATALAAVRRFRQLADQCNVADLHVLATAAAREAANGPAFIEELERICRVPVQVLSGAEEARLAALGIQSGMHEPDGVAGDLGGGSLELVDLKGQRVGQGRTYPLGGIRLSEAAEGSPRRAEKIAEEILKSSEVLTGLPGRAFYAVGGTWRSLAKLHMHQTGYPLHVMHEYAIRADEALDFCRMVGRGDIDALDRIEVISKQRRDLLAYGATVLAQIIRFGRPKEVVLSALGLREGHLYDLLPEEERRRDPLISASEELAALRSRSPRHAHELGPWTGRVFEALGIDETAEEKRLRVAACLLSDIGWRAHPDYRGEQSLNIIAHAAFIGVDHPGRAYLALASFYRHMGLIDEALSPRIRELASTRYKERARCLGAAFRVAYILSAAMPGIIPQVGIHARDNRLILSLPPQLAQLEGEVVLRRLRQLAKLGGLDAVVEVA